MSDESKLSEEGPNSHYSRSMTSLAMIQESSDERLSLSDFLMDFCLCVHVAVPA